MIKKMIFSIAVIALPVFLMCTSIYSFFGMPESGSGRDIIGAGMGDTGIGNLLRPNSSLRNASLSCNNQYTIFSTGFSLGSVNVEDKRNSTSFDGDISYFPY